MKRLARRWEGLRDTLYSTYVMTSSVNAAWKRCQRPSASRSRTFGRARRPVQIASVPTLVFGHEDLLLHLTMHLKADAFVDRVRTLCDIGETCRRYGDAIDWNQLIARACAYDLAKPLYYVATGRPAHGDGRSASDSPRSDRGSDPEFYQAGRSSAETPSNEGQRHDGLP